MATDIGKLLRVDLNLLISLQVLLEEQNVSKAAKRLFITQPAMSKSLGRLREAFNDPLFIRTSHGIRPTPRALEIGRQLPVLLQGIDHLVQPPQFNPATYRGSLTIATAEYMAHAVMPRLLAVLDQEAPGVSISSVSRVENQLEQLATGDLDIALHIRRNWYPPEFTVTEMACQEPVLLARSSHPLAGTTPSWEDIQEFPYVSFYIADAEELAVYQHETMRPLLLQQQAQKPRFETAHLLTALEVVRNTDFLMMAPPIVLLDAEIRRRIVALPMPDTLFSIDYMLVNHKRTERSPIHQYLRTLIMDIIDDLKIQMQAQNLVTQSGDKP